VSSFPSLHIFPFYVFYYIKDLRLLSSLNLLLLGCVGDGPGWGEDVCSCLCVSVFVRKGKRCFHLRHVLF
jgi:hypothetical protein